MLEQARSAAAFAAAQKVIPGGVNSPVRSFKNVGGTPPFIDFGKGCEIVDIDGNRYIDYVLSYGPLILGHAPEAVTEALIAAAKRGTSYGAPTLAETKLAELVHEFFPTVEMVRMVNSGTEATMSALRLARAYTGREKIVKFEGCYHGHHDSLLVKAGSGATTLGVPDSPGVPKGVAADTLTVPYNNIEALEAVFREQGEAIAAVIIEPTPGNMGLVLPQKGYLQAVRKLTEQYGTVLIFDEVMSGFRASRGGSQAVYGIRPDLTCLGKIIGGGLPVGAYGGRRDIMEHVAPVGSMYQAGTLSGNPLAMAAGIATLTALKERSVPEALETHTAILIGGMKEKAEKHGLSLQFHRIGSMFTCFFTDQPVIDYATALTSDQRLFGVYFKAMLERGVYLAPSQFETGFLSEAHTPEFIQKTIDAADEAFALVANTKK